jgi:hypothetical protein
MSSHVDHLDLVVGITEGLRRTGLDAVMVGGMALVVLGSRRVTRDFDFVIPAPGDRLHEVVAVMYGFGLALVSRLDDAGHVIATIDNERVANARLRIDRPVNATFHHTSSGLRVDLLFDFPVPAVDLVARATRLRLRNHHVLIASEEDLLMLKEVAAAAREAPGDAEDIAFLKARRRS